MIVIINGAPASGKTKTAKLLSESIDKSALIDGDWLLATHPHDHGDQRYLRYKNITSLAKNYHEAGFTNIFIAFVYARAEDITEQVNQLAEIDTVKVFALTPHADTLKKRHSEDDYNRANIDETLDLHSKIQALESMEIIDNTNLSPEEVVEQIKSKLVE